MATYNKLKGRIYEKYGNLAKFSEELGVKPAYVSAKLNGSAGFTPKVIDRWSQLLGISVKEYYLYFFADGVKRG